MREIAVAFDIGNSGGKLVAATMEEGKLALLDEETLENHFIEINGSAYWDIFSLFEGLKAGLRRFSEFGDVVSVGVDATSGRYAYVGRNGRLAGYVASGRDGRYVDWARVVEKKTTLRDLYDSTGVYPERSNNVVKILCDLENGDLAPGADVVFMQLSALMRYALTGQMAVERSMAGASVMMDAQFSDWNYPLFSHLGIPWGICPPIAEPASVGPVFLPDVARETNCPNCRFVSTVEFDSSAAMLSAPNFNRDRVYLSMGTTINPGVELDAPVISEDAWRFRYKNVPLWPGSVMLLSDIPGFFLITECLNFWRAQGMDIGHGDLVRAAEACDNASFLNLFDARLCNACPDMPETIRDFCRESGQRVPESVGEVARCVYESYAATLKWSIEKLGTVTGRRNYEGITAISGGARNALLCQMISDACGLPLSAGNPNATALGNLLVQFHALGLIDGLSDMRRVAGEACPMRSHVPGDPAHFEAALAFMIKKEWLAF